MVALAKQLIDRSLDQFGKILFTALLIMGGFVTIVGSGLGLILARNYAQARSDWWSSVWRRPVLKRVGAWTAVSWLWLSICGLNWLLWPRLIGLGGAVHLGATLALTWVGGLWLLWSGFRLDGQLALTWRRWTQTTFQEMLRLGFVLTGILFVDICGVITICLWPATALVVVGLVFTWQQRCFRRLARRIE